MSRLALAVLFSGLFVCVLSAQEAVGPKCSGYTLYKDAGGYLMYHEMPVTFDDAKLRCAVEGGVLASPINDGIKAAMMDILKTRNVEKVFTGFSSVEGTRLSNIEPTARGEPNNYKNNENCIALSPHGTLSDVMCYHQYPYVCFLSEVKFKTMDICSGNIAGYAALENTTGSCYKWHSNKLVFDEAVKVCEQEGGHLLIINGDDEAQAAKNLIVKNNLHYALVGFQRNKNSGKWVTLQGETIEDAGYAKWDPEAGQDSEQGTYSGVITNDGLLHYTELSYKFPFICEKDPEIVVC